MHNKSIHEVDIVYNPRQMYSAVAGYVKDHKALAITAAAGLVAVLAGCAGAKDEKPRLHDAGNFVAGKEISLLDPKVKNPVWLGDGYRHGIPESLQGSQSPKMIYRINFSLEGIENLLQDPVLAITAHAVAYEWRHICEDTVTVNGKYVGSLDEVPHTGNYKNVPETRAKFKLDRKVLTNGKNTVEIKSTSCNDDASDADDFSITEIRIQ